MASNNNLELLFVTDNLFSNHPIQILSSKKKGDKIELQYFPLDKKNIGLFFPDLPDAMKKALDAFGNPALEALQTEILERFSKGKGLDRDAFREKQYLSAMHERWERLMPLTGLAKWRHYSKGNSKKATNAPASFNLHRPRLQFKVTGGNGQFDISVLVSVNGLLFHSWEFKQLGFFLMWKNEFFLLRLSDHKTLEWLRTGVPAAWKADAALFKEKVIAALETQYPVDRSGHFTPVLVQGPPLCRVRLSELSGSFLMLTPQWLYEGIVVELPFKAKEEIHRGGETYSIERDPKEETVFVELLREMHPNFKNQHNGYFFLPFSEAQKKSWFLNAYHELLDKNIDMVGMDMLRHFRYSKHKAVTKVEIVTKGDVTLTLGFAICFGNETVPLPQ